MTALTQNLPPVVRNLGISIIGQECYTSLVENLDFSNVECIKYSLSKGVGLGIVVGGSIVKVPQIILVLKSHSAEGLSLGSYILETLSYCINLLYSFKNGFPFSTYGENFFLTFQNALITQLIVFFSPNAQEKIILVAGGLAVFVSTLSSLSTEILSYLQIATLPLSLFAKIPQITQNYRSKSTGQLSAFAVIAQILGCVARLFTTMQEVGDPVVLTGFALALMLNGVLGAQLWMYWGAQPKKVEEKAPEAAKGEVMTEVNGKVQAYDQPPRPQTPPRPHAPSFRTGTPPPSGGRKWSRKLD
ncbi:mannose-P-dolichol utilization defect 1 protein [Guyanagaster necrorhizus]|uniref:Mannose-P-dolichol utilization defect 1 protein homolog n=1 Tax=Guyanagaster necrorhizus TaxID=856835 RepID=A0A9P7VLW6_9AGAR|nr:mannose-P-dolichol utilization defect 1 protein [Guyanagaster necrorhizus MCA 3950]KAG7442930.1 mannose-P-dolichol utilization defect 1 protein [Guyanagaster necrorhizus MCA 3950]